MKRRQRGFTLVEAMVGVTILTILTLAMTGQAIAAESQANRAAHVHRAEEEAVSRQRG